MKTAKLRFLCAVALGAMWLAGCSTPATRIKNNPEAFARLPAAQQALVRAGQIGMGMDETAVRLAAGEPDRITVRTDADGETRVWRYVNYTYYGGYGWGGYGWGGHGWGGYGWGGHGYGGYGWGGYGWGGHGYGGLYAYGPSEVYDRLRIEFKNGVVTAIVQETRR